MARKGSSKWFSEQQENYIARLFGGVRSPSSGGADTDRGDVRLQSTLIECKHTGSFLKPAKSISVKLSDLEKLADEAWSEGKDFALALRLYAPDSVLSDSSGMVDLVVRMATADVEING